MLRSALFSLALALCTVVTVGAQPVAPAPNPVFDDAVLPTIHLTVAPADLEFLYAPGNEENDVEFPATFRFDNGTINETVENVGFRLRGNTSRYSQKKSLKVSFNAFEPGRSFYGLEKLNLNGEHNDPSIVRAKLSWDLFQAMGVPASRANHVQVFINGVYYGLYINVEHVDERFLGARFESNDGNLYKCLWPADLTYLGPGAEAYRPTGDDRRPYDLHLKDNDDAGYADLAHFIDVLNNTPDGIFPQALEAVFNVNGYLKALAVDVAVGSWDDYWFLKNNYYLYQNPATGRFEFIPYDYDNTFGIWWDGILPGLDWGTRNVYAWGHPGEPRPLVSRILAVPEFRARFTFYLRRLLDGPFRPDVLLPRIEALHAMITPAAEADTYRTLDYGFDVEAFHASYTEALGGHVTYGLLAYIDARWAAAQDQLEDTNVEPFFIDIRATPAHPRPADPIAVTALIEDEEPLASVELRYQINGGAQQVAPLYDDGLHADGAAGDGRFGVVLPAFPAETRVVFRIFATDAAGQTSFSTARVVETVLDPPPLYINEFMASNAATIADETGAFPDWVELYNGGAEPIALGGYRLTDDLGAPDKWTLPDVTIEPGGFLLVWADGDVEQGALHTSYSLDRDGEQLGLFDPALVPVDTLSFGFQETDVAYGRTPDGTGPFSALAAATPGASNTTDTALEPEQPPHAFTLDAAYPNPFTTEMTVGFTLPQAGRVSAGVYDVLGRRVRRLVDGPLLPGTYRQAWDGLDDAGQPVPSGVYFIRLHAATAPGTLTTRVVRVR